MTVPAAELLTIARQAASSVTRNAPHLRDDARGAAVVKLVELRPHSAKLAYYAARNAAIDWIRQHEGRTGSRQLMRSKRELPLIDDAAGVVDDHVDVVHTLVDLERALRHLTDRQRELVRLVASGLGHREIGELWGVTESAVSLIYTATIRRLRAHLKVPA